jgi:hypothetical protein
VSVPFGTLGTVVFRGGFGTANAFYEISKKRQAAYAKHQIIWGTDILEPVGSTPIEITLSIQFLRGYSTDPSGGILALETLMAAKTAVPLVIGGVPVGRGLLALFVVEQLDAKMKKFQGGTLIACDVTVRLMEDASPLSGAGIFGSLAQLGGSLLSGGGTNIQAMAGSFATTALGTIPSAKSLFSPAAGVLSKVAAVAIPHL